ncbi:MAG: hypothetical protein ABIN57_10725 [Chitinophagaceae bacterium]
MYGIYLLAPLLSSLFFLAAFLGLLVVTNLLFTKYNLPVDRSRKFLHITGGLLSLTIPFFIQSHWWVLVICTLAFAVLLGTYFTHQLDAVHKTNRTSVGSIIFPIPVYICFAVAAFYGNTLLFFIPISILTVADPAAEWGGKRWGKYTATYFNQQKTLAGTLCFAATAIFICLFFAFALSLPADQKLLIIFCVPLIASIAELVSLKGWDNLTVPLLSLVALLLIVTYL